MKKVILRLVILVVLAGAGWGAYRFFKQMPERQEQVPTAKVVRGDVVIRAYSRGELRAVRTTPLYAPNLFGTVQVTDLAPVGALAREKDLIVEYDDSERQSALEEAKLSVQSVDEQIKKARADLAIQESQDQVTLLKTGYDVRRAQLEVKRNPIISVIDAKKNVLTLEQQKRALQQLQTDIQARKEQTDSQLAVLQEQRNRSMLDVTREIQRIQQTKTLAPITGLVSIKQNRAGNFNFGQQMPDIREGDTLQPGMGVADLLHLSELEVWAKVGELDRANLKEGQEAQLQLDAVPDKRFRGKIKAMSGTATSDVFSGDPSKKFDVVFSLDMRQLLGGLGMKPADIDRIMATAEANAKKNVGGSTPQFGAQQQGDPGAAGMPGAGRGPGPGGQEGRQNSRQDNQDQGGGRRRGDGPRGQGAAGGGDVQGRGQGQGAEGAQGRGGFGNMSAEDRQKMRQLREQMQAASPDEREKLQKQLQELFTKAGITMPAGQGRGFGGRGQSEGQTAGDGQSRGQGGGRQGRGGPGGAAGGVGDPMQMMMNRRGSGSQFSDEDRKNAKLPLPPSQDSQVQVLLRPGLLADVEIQVEKLPNVVHVPAQAVFQKNGKYTVFVQKQGKFETRDVQLVKQSESMMVIASGVQPGDVVALADPTAGKKDKNGDKKSGGGPMGGMPGGK